MHRLLILLLINFYLCGMEEQIPESDSYLEKTANWQIIPVELKGYIFSLIPEEITNLALINHECYKLTKESFFLKALVLFLIDKDLTKAVNLYAHAFEQDNAVLIEILFEAKLPEKIAPEAALGTLAKESIFIAISGPVITNEIQTNNIVFIKALTKQFPQAARKIFIKAARQGDLSLINICLDNNIKIDFDNDYDSHGLNALIHAAYMGHLKIVQLLVTKGADVNAKDAFGYSVLMHSAAKSNVETVEFLLDQGAEINAINIFGETPLTFAAIYGNIEVMLVLLDRKADIEGKPYGKSKYDYRASPLLRAVNSGQEEAVNILLNHGAQINAVDKDKRNALHIVSYSDHYNIAKILIENGIEKNAKDHKGYTPLMNAVLENNLDMVKLLLSLKADPNIQTKLYKKGKTALIFACILGYGDIVEELLPASNINAIDEFGSTALKLILRKIEKCDNFDNEEAQNYLKIIALLNQNATKEGKLSTVERTIQSFYDKLFDNLDLPRLALSFTATLTLAAIVIKLKEKYKIDF